MLRRLELSDMDVAARIHRIAFDRALPGLAGLHTPEEDRSFFREHVFAACELWGAFGDAGMAGMIAFRKDWIDQLYVLPEAQGRGIGSSLLRRAQTSFDHLQLWPSSATGPRAASTKRAALRWCGKPTARAMRKRSLMRSICGRGEMRLRAFKAIPATRSSMISIALRHEFQGKSQHDIALDRQCVGMDRAGGRPRRGGVLRPARTIRQAAAGPDPGGATCAARRSGRQGPGY
jgi:GNAT superfamily N-acetyltransferase